MLHEINIQMEDREMATTTLTKEELAKLPKELRERVEGLVSENELLHKVAEGKMSLKVSEKGAVSVYGMGRWPVTLYQEQWIKLLDNANTIREFITANKDKLKTKLQAAAEGLEKPETNGNGAGK